MGVDTNLHIGPYLVVEGTKTTNSIREVYTCSNDECVNNINNKQLTGKFCNNCGSSNETKQYTKSETIDPHDLTYSDEYEDVFCDELTWTNPMNTDDEGVFIANETAPFDTQSRCNPDECRDVDLSNVNIQDEINWFVEKYKPQIDIFKKEFGEHSAQVKWGIVQWYS